MAVNDLHIRTMNREEMDIAVEWAAREGWNPGLHDAESFYAADPGGFLIGELGGKPVASISVVKYGNAFGFLGFYIVKPEHRGKGYGLRIWEAGIERLKGLNTGLDGVVDQQHNYQKSGYELAYRNIRQEGKAVGEMPRDPHLIELDELPFEQVENYDREFFPAPRSAFLRAWLNQPGRVALAMVENGELRGYGMARPCRSGYKIGPLFADGAERAEVLYRGLSARLPEGAPLYLDTPEPNQAAVDLAKRHGMSPVFETARMYTGPIPDLPLERLYGVTSFELG